MPPMSAHRNPNYYLARAAATYRTIAPAAPAVDAPAVEVPDDAEETDDGEEEAAEVALWEGVIGVEGIVTGDGRLIEAGALTWPDDLGVENPLGFRNVSEDVGFHDGAEVIGHIFGIERRDGGLIWAYGDIVLDSDEAERSVAEIRDGRARGVSMDLDEIAWQTRVRADIVAEEDAFMEAMLNESPESDWTPPEREEIDGYVVVDEDKPDDMIMVMMAAEIRTATKVAVPAFRDAEIAIVDAWSVSAPAPDAIVDDSAADDAEDASEEDPAAITAAAAPVAPPRAWFADPKLDGPTPLTVTEDGRVFGHAATFDQCHVASPAGEGICVLAPHSKTGYARFHLGSLLTDDGETISVGKITMGTGHAGPSMRAAAAAAHYDNTGAAVADVRAGEDKFGIWISGALRPTATDEQVRALRASPISGDWRKVDGNLELVAALAVNVPGFPVIPRPAGLVASGELSSLVASGIVLEPTPEAAATLSLLDHLSTEDIDALRRLAAREREATAQAARDRVNSFAARARVARFVSNRNS